MVKIIQHIRILKHFGSVIDSREGYKEEIDNRLPAPSHAYQALKNIRFSNNNATKRIKIVAYKAIIISVFLYGSERCGINIQQTSKVQTFEMKYLRKIEGETMTDIVRCECFRSQLNVKSVAQLNEGKQRQWFGYFVTLPHQRRVTCIW